MKVSHPPVVREGRPGVDRPPVMLAFGGGLNSAAMLLGMYERGEKPDATVFADTGGEKPDTYHFLFRFDDWMVAHDFPRTPNFWRRPPGYEWSDLPEKRQMRCLQVVRSTGKYLTLEQNCLDKRLLPALSYGGRSCSEKYKQRPQHHWAKLWRPARQWWQLTEAGRRRRPKNRLEEELFRRRVVKCIGYDATEGHRGDGITGDDFYEYRYPLREWGWERSHCAAACERHGLTPPGKSACFFCPASKKEELIQLGVRYPRLMERALALEDNAREGMKVKGIGRWFSWREFFEGKVGKIVVRHLPCVCHAEVVEGEGVDAQPADDEWSAEPQGV